MIFDKLDKYTTESVLQGHPDKICDQISDALLDAYLMQDCNAHTAIECLGSGNNLIVAGEVSTQNTRIDIEGIVNDVYQSIGYSEKLNILNFLSSQSRQLNDAVMNGGAGDQGIVYGYAINNQYNFLPYGAYISNLIAKEIDKYRKSVDYLLPDGKVQVAISENNIEQLTINVQHKEKIHPDIIENDIKQKVLIPLIDCKNVDIQINRKSKFYKGGFVNDTGLTGRKIMIDTYGGLVTHGGGAFSGKDPSKIDRSAAYMARFVAKNIVANGLEEECKIAVAYLFGEENPTMLNVSTDKESNSTKLKQFILSKFDFRPKAIIELLKLKNHIYRPTSIYGHYSNPNYNWEQIISL